MNGNTRRPTPDGAPTIVDMPATADPEILAMFRMWTADVLRHFVPTNALQRDILRRGQALQAKFTSTDVPKVGT